jgi:hypothetical protein
MFLNMLTERGISAGNNAYAGTGTTLRVMVDGGPKLCFSPDDSTSPKN